MTTAPPRRLPVAGTRTIGSIEAGATTLVVGTLRLDPERTRDRLHDLVTICIGTTHGNGPGLRLSRDGVTRLLALVAEAQRVAFGLEASAKPATPEAVTTTLDHGEPAPDGVYVPGSPATRNKRTTPLAAVAALHATGRRGTR